MHEILIIARDDNKAGELDLALAQEGFRCLVVSSARDMVRQFAEHEIELAIVDMNGSTSLAWIESVRAQIQEIRLKRQLPVIALISSKTLDSISSDVIINDFVIQPCGLSELMTRMKRILGKPNDGNDEELIECDDLAINLAKCEVSINSRVLSLTFKEYELLKYLANNRGRVFSREALLNEVWGYDYYGGDRTVDVHIRRLRSKIEDATHTFIETVRNIGYRFRA